MPESTPTQAYAAPKKKGVVDIVFLLDATGSMQPCIDAVKANIHTFIKSMVSEDANGGVILSDWRASVCAYRDFTYEPRFGKEAMRVNPFTSDVDELYRQLDAITASGGGDEPESLLDGLYEVINRGKTDKGATPEEDKWRYTSDAARCIIVFTDASFHPAMEVVQGAGVEDVKDLILQERIRLSLFAPELECHYELAEADRCVYEAIEIEEGEKAAQALLRFVQDSSHFTKTMELLAKSVSASASADTEEL